MTEQRALLDRRAWQHFKRHVRILIHSEVGGRALGLFALLIAIAIGVNGLSVVNSYVARDFMTAIANRDQAGFIRYALVWLGVFAGATVVSVVSRFIEQRLGLLWRRFQTARGLRLYASHRIYLHVGESDEIGNPDQRLTDDVKSFSATTLSFVLELTNSALTILAFSGVLWSISPLLLGVAVLYAGLGSSLTILIGRPLIRLNFDQLDKEANLRAELIHFRENAHAIALSRRESTLARRMLHRLDELVENLVKLIAVNRNVGFLTTFYNWSSRSFRLC